MRLNPLAALAIAGGAAGLASVAQAELDAELHLNAAASRGVCSINMGSLHIDEGGRSYAAKCEGNVSPPMIWTWDASVGDKVLDFASFPNSTGQVTRTEVTLADLPYGTYKYIGFAMMIPAYSQARFSDWFVLMQFWACSPLEPFAAFRLKRETSHTWELIARNDETPGGEAGDAVAAQGDLIPGVWHTFVLRVFIDPGGTSTLKLWTDGGSSQTWYGGSIGYDERHCSNGYAPNPWGAFRVKFGIYKNSENAYHEVMFDDLRVADSFQEAKPW